MYKVLDAGYVKVIETWGSDERIVEAARMSTNKGFLGWEERHGENCGCGPGDHISKCKKINYGDGKLLRFLYEHKHFTPFEMAGIIIEVQAPIMVFREWHRHRTQSYNEMSARYIPIPDENYRPTVERLLINSKTNKQAGTVKGAAQLTDDAASEWLRRLNESYGIAENVYQLGLDAGVPKELARLCLPVGRYSRMRASANLRNWLGFLALRMDEAAQWEIRQYANVVGEIIAAEFPRTWSLFEEGRKK